MSMLETITLGGGCFWCIEAAYRRSEGVISAKSGYMGGRVKNPSYEAVCKGDTGHAEVVQIVFDPAKTSVKKLLELFWKLHDPTTLNRQGMDVGTQYRSAIFTSSEAQQALAETSKAEAARAFSSPIVTKIEKASTFYPAEAYHQDYYSQNRSKNPYCKIVIEPKLKKAGIQGK